VREENGRTGGSRGGGSNDSSDVSGPKPKQGECYSPVFDWCLLLLLLLPQDTAVFQLCVSLAIVV